MPAQIVQCKDCKFCFEFSWEKTDGSGTAIEYHCRRHAPLDVNTGHRRYSDSYGIEVEENYWCGDSEPRDQSQGPYR